MFLCEIFFLIFFLGVLLFVCLCVVVLGGFCGVLGCFFCCCCVFFWVGVHIRERVSWIRPFTK